MARTIKFEFDPFEGREAPIKKREAMEEIAFLIHAETLRYVSDGNSPVSGNGKFQKLNKNYAKREKGGNTTPNLDLTGAMLSALDVTVTGNKIRVQIKGKEGDKADGHNNFSGDSKLPLRRFIPNEEDNEFFKRDIEKSINEIIDSYEIQNKD